MQEKNDGMSIEEAEKYGLKTDARNAALEKNYIYAEEEMIPANKIPPPLSEEEIKKRVGEGNYTNIHKNDGMNSINS